MVTTFPAQAAIVAGLAYAGTAGNLQVWELLLGVVAVSILWDIAWAAFFTVPRLLLTPDELFAAGGVSGVVGSVTNLAGYALGGAAVVGLGPAGGLWVYSVALAVAALLAALNPIRSRGEVAAGFWRSMREGWRLILVAERSTLGALAGSDVARALVFAGPTLLTVVVAQVDFQTSAVAFAAFFVASVVGATTADVALGRLNPRRRIGTVLVVGMIGSALAVVGLAVLPPVLAGFLVVWFLIGGLGEAYVNARTTYVHGHVPAELQGRIAGNMYLFTGLPGAVGAVWLGSYAATGSLLWTTAIVAVGFLVTAALLFAWSPLRRLAF